MRGMPVSLFLNTPVSAGRKSSPTDAAQLFMLALDAVPQAETPGTGEIPKDGTSAGLQTVPGRNQNQSNGSRKGARGAQVLASVSPQAQLAAALSAMTDALKAPQRPEPLPAGTGTGESLTSVSGDGKPQAVYERAAQAQASRATSGPVTVQSRQFASPVDGAEAAAPATVKSAEGPAQLWPDNGFSVRQNGITPLSVESAKPEPAPDEDVPAATPHPAFDTRTSALSPEGRGITQAHVEFANGSSSLRGDETLDSLEGGVPATSPHPAFATLTSALSPEGRGITQAHVEFANGSSSLRGDETLDSLEGGVPAATPHPAFATLTSALSPEGRGITQAHAALENGSASLRGDETLDSLDEGVPATTPHPAFATLTSALSPEGRGITQAHAALENGSASPRVEETLDSLDEGVPATTPHPAFATLTSALSPEGRGITQAHAALENGSASPRVEETLDSLDEGVPATTPHPAFATLTSALSPEGRGQGYSRDSREGQGNGNAPPRDNSETLSATRTLSADPAGPGAAAPATSSPNAAASVPSSAALPKSVTLLQEILKTTPKPLQPMLLEVRAEGYGPVYLRITPSSSQSGARVEVRTADPQAQALLTAHSQALRQALQVETLTVNAPADWSQGAQSGEYASARLRWQEMRGPTRKRSRGQMSEEREDLA